MSLSSADSAIAALVVVNPSGHKSRVSLEPVPYSIGRQSDNHLVLRDNRASRNHARIIRDGEYFFVEDLNSRHGVFVNGQRVTRHRLGNSDRIDFGFQDSYKLIFTQEEDEIHRLLDQIAPAPAAGPGGANLARLRALVEVARALQSSLSTEDVLSAVVDAALAVTGTDRGFLLLRKDDQLDVAVARDRAGRPLASTDLKVPTTLINRALRTRRELLSMSFDPHETGSVHPDVSVANLELRSVVCVPLVHVRTGGNVQETMISSVNDTVGMLYMDSRQVAADLSSGNRELLQTLALEASTIIENARLLEEEREKRRIEEELKIARAIQRDLLPSELPVLGWFRASGSSVPSRQVGGDYFDVRRAGPDKWSAIVADVSGKGVSSALLASLVQGVFLLASESCIEIGAVMSHLNRFLTERTRGEKYATAFYCTIDRRGILKWSNAGHPKPYLVRAGKLNPLETTGMPLGMLEDAAFGELSLPLQAGDKLVIFSDGVSEAENREGLFFDKAGLKETLLASASLGSASMHAAIVDAVEKFATGVELGDDVTVLVLEYQPGI